MSSTALALQPKYDAGPAMPCLPDRRGVLPSGNAQAGDTGPAAGVATAPGCSIADLRACARRKRRPHLRRSAKAAGSGRCACAQHSLPHATPHLLRDAARHAHAPDGVLRRGAGSPRPCCRPSATVSHAHAGWVGGIISLLTWSRPFGKAERHQYQLLTPTCCAIFAQALTPTLPVSACSNQHSSDCVLGSETDDIVCRSGDRPEEREIVKSAAVEPPDTPDSNAESREEPPVAELVQSELHAAAREGSAARYRPCCKIAAGKACPPRPGLWCRVRQWDRSLLCSQTQHRSQQLTQCPSAHGHVMH